MWKLIYIILIFTFILYSTKPTYESLNDLVRKISRDTLTENVNIDIRVYDYIILKIGTIDVNFNYPSMRKFQTTYVLGIFNEWIDSPKDNQEIMKKIVTFNDNMFRHKLDKTEF
jgi:hypothetical protein